MVTEVQSRGWQSASRVLCVRLDSLGDVLMTTPALRALRSLPAVEHITLLTSSGGAEVARLVDGVDEVWPVDVAWLKHTPQRRSPAYELDLIQRIGQANFDASVIFTVLTQSPLPSAMVCYLAGVPLRLAHCRENPYQLLTDWIIDTETPHSARHEVTRQLDLVRHVGATTSDDRLSLRIGSGAQARIASWLDNWQLCASDRWCVIHPGATAESRRYPADGYAEVASRLEQLGFGVVVTGSLQEAELVARVVVKCSQAITIVGKLNAEELAALIQRAPILLTNNTGPAHISAAVGTPVVDLYALTNSQHTPWRVPQRVLYHDVPCRNCLKSVCPQGHHDCLARVTTESVVQAVVGLWNETRFHERPSTSVNLVPLPVETPLEI